MKDLLENCTRRRTHRDGDMVTKKRQRADGSRTDRFFNGKRAANSTERVPVCAVKNKITHRFTRSGYTASLDSNVP